MTFRLVRELSRDGIDVAVACRVLHLSRSTYYDWLRRGPSLRDEDDAHLLNVMRDIHSRSRGTYGAPRIHPNFAWDLVSMLARSGWHG